MQSVTMAPSLRWDQCKAVSGPWRTLAQGLSAETWGRRGEDTPAEAGTDGKPSL